VEFVGDFVHFVRKGFIIFILFDELLILGAKSDHNNELIILNNYAIWFNFIIEFNLLGLIIK
jgi:hypothetical protein